MKFIDKVIQCEGRGDVFELYPLGDLHIGARNCAETPLKKLVKEISDKPNALVVGGGDLMECIKPQDTKRFDFDILPDWMIEGDACTTRDMLNDVVAQQVDRTEFTLTPIRNKLLGLICGNHEYQLMKRYNHNVQAALCRRLDTVDLTDEALIRLRFKRNNGAGKTVIIYIRHGYGGGRTAGAEPNKLDRMIAEWECAEHQNSQQVHG